MSASTTFYGPDYAFRKDVSKRVRRAILVRQRQLTHLKRILARRIALGSVMPARTFFQQLFRIEPEVVPAETALEPTLEVFPAETALAPAEIVEASQAPAAPTPQVAVETVTPVKLRNDLAWLGYGGLILYFLGVLAFGIFLSQEPEVAKWIYDIIFNK